MVRINKFVLGIRPANKMFRLGSLAGILIDSILDARSEKSIGGAYFTEIGRAADGTSLRLASEQVENTLLIDEANIVFTKDAYLNDQHVDIDKVMTEWGQLWAVINKILSVRGIHRIGIAAEHQFMPQVGTPSNLLLEKLTKLPHVPHAGKFMLQFEERRPTTNKVGVPELNKDEFINVITHYYDGVMDNEHSNSAFLNANLDVQKYFAPSFNGNVLDEVQRLLKIFQKEKVAFEKNLKERGLV